MKITIFLIPALIMMLSSCEKVINVDLNNAERKYVIEAVVMDVSNSCVIYISQTKNFDEDNNFPGISGAEVSMSEDDNVPVLIPEAAPGFYRLRSFVGKPGSTYRLRVEVDGQVFTSSSTMPQKVLYDSLFVRDNSFFNEKVKLANIRFTDPPGKGNYYRFVQTINGEKDNTVFIRDDDLIDGDQINNQLFGTNDDEDAEDPSKIKSGDDLKVDMHCIDAAVYKYWFSLDQSSLGESESASPGNPVTNISGGALGYFSAHTFQTGSVTVP